MKIIDKRIILSLLGAVLGLLVGCGGGKSEGGLRIAYLPITHTLPLLAANEIQSDDHSRLPVELLKFGSWNELADAFNTHSVDGAVVLAEIAVKMRENGVPLKAVALGHHDGNVMVVANDIDSVADLCGKTVAIPHRLSSHNILLQMVLRRAGLDPKSVYVTELPPPEMPAALSEGRIAAYVVAEPFGARGVVSGVGKVLYSSPEVWEHSVCCTLVLREEAIAERRDEVAAFVKLYERAADSLSVDRDFAVAISKKYLKVDECVIAQSLEWIDFSDLRLKTPQYDTLGLWMKRLNLVKRDVPFTDFADTTLLKR